MRKTMNAPTFAYYTLYEKLPIPPISGREASHPNKVVDGINIDDKVPTNAFRKLLAISEIETRACCQGEDERHPTFLIFRMKKDENKKFIETLVDCLNKYNNIKAACDLGTEGKYRICVTWKTWVGQPDYDGWWSNLAGKIKASLLKTKTIIR